MRITSLFITALLIAGCVSPGQATGKYETARALYLRTKELPGFADYVDVFIKSRKAQHLDRPACYQKTGPQRIILILIVDRSGRITEADSDVPGEKAGCFRKVFLGARMPIPPFAPLAVPLAVE
jgi:hypothetical protein